MTDAPVLVVSPTGMSKVHVILALAPSADPGPLYLAAICPTNARLARMRWHDGPVLGGIVPIRSGWASVAYTDRDHFTNHTGNFAFLDDTSTLPDAAAGLIRHWRKSPANRRKITSP